LDKPKTDAGAGVQQSRDTAVTLTTIAAIAGYVLLSVKIGAGFAIVVGILGACGLTALGVLRGPVGRALARKIDRQGGGSAEELDELHARLDQLEAGQGRIAELEERLDFAERLLTQGREEPRLPEKAG
jgi:hypothetical protein